MENENKHCYSCKYYKPYYTKGYNQFDRCDIGLCSKKKETVDRENTCGKFEWMFYPRINRRNAALSAIVEHISILAEIKQLLEEDDDEAIKELFFEFKNRKKR